MGVLHKIRELAGQLASAGAVLSGEAAAHVHLAVATCTVLRGAPGYTALAPRRIEALFPEGAGAMSGVVAAEGAIADVLRHRMDLYSRPLPLLDGTLVPTLTREAVLAELLSRGGLALGLAGILIGRAGDPPIDADDVRDILKAARQGERFQPLLELLQVA